jgi:hypothetical protein
MNAITSEISRAKLYRRGLASGISYGRDRPAIRFLLAAARKITLLFCKRCSRETVCEHGASSLTAEVTCFALRPLARSPPPWRFSS